MNYLFLDLEWYSKDNDNDLEDTHILELGAFYCSNNFKNETSFFSFVSTAEDIFIPQATLSFLRTKRKTITNAPSLLNVLNAFAEKYTSFDYLVTWSRFTYDLFLNSLKSSGFAIPKHKVICLQEVANIAIKHKCQSIGFEAALKQCGVYYKKESLHNASYDVSCLKKLYCNLKLQYERTYLEERKCYCVKSTKSNIIHTRKCPYVKRIDSSHLIETTPLEILNGAEVCEICAQKRNVWLLNIEHTESILKHPENQFDDAYIRKACNYLNLQYQIGEGVIFIKGLTNWRIFHNYYKITEVRHENYKASRYSSIRKPDKKGKTKEGFHAQENIKSKDLYGILQYIHNHEKYFFKNRNANNSRSL